MSERTSEKSRCELAPSNDKARSHPLDAWLRREFKAKFANLDDEPLPEDMARLAERLKHALATCGESGKDAERG